MVQPHARQRRRKAKPYLGRAEFRQAISYGVDREAIVKTVFLGAAEPVHGPITPGNATWYSPAAPTFPYDPAKARTLLAGIGLTDRNGDGMLDDGKGRPVRFSIITQGGHIRERTATMIQEQLRQLGIGVDIVALDPPSIFGRFGGDYESIYYGFQAGAMDPAMNLDMWMSGGPGHVWNLGAGRRGRRSTRSCCGRARRRLAERQRPARGPADLCRAPAADLFRGAEGDGRAEPPRRRRRSRCREPKISGTRKRSTFGQRSSHNAV